MSGKVFILLIIALLTVRVVEAQNDTTKNLYLGQTPPGATPVTFSLAADPGLFVAERITVSTDGREIYYTDLDNYPISRSNIKCYKFNGTQWTGPFIIMSNYSSPALSPDNKRLFFQNSSTQPSYSIRTDTGWSSPIPLMPEHRHYLQLTNSGNFYACTDSAAHRIGGYDFAKADLQNNADTLFQSLGLPLCTTDDEGDYFIARDESFLLTAGNSSASAGLSISYHKPDGSWTNPKNLGKAINPPGSLIWGPYVTQDNKYLFFTSRNASTGTSINWVRIDHLIDSLKHTNFAPYIKKPLVSQTAQLNTFFSYQIPDSVFYDDDGTNTLTLSVTWSNGAALSDWLSFDPATRTLSGTPTTVAIYNLKATAKDSGGASVSARFQIKVTAQLGIKSDNKNLPATFSLEQNYPNPFNPSTKIQYTLPTRSRVRITVFNSLGKLVDELVNGEIDAGQHATEWQAKVVSGIYFCRIEAISLEPGSERFVDVKKMTLLR